MTDFGNALKITQTAGKLRFSKYAVVAATFTYQHFC